MPFPISIFDNSCVILMPKSENCAANELANKYLVNKKNYCRENDYHFESFIKQPVIKQKLVDIFRSFFSLSLIKAFVKSKILIRFHHLGFIIRKN